MLKIVQNHQEEYIHFNKKLVSIQSYPCQEKEVAQYILEELQKLPIDEAFIDGCGNVIGILRGEGDGPNIVLNGHMDAVPEGNLEKWAPFKPYEPEIVDGKFYGRGIADMKAGLAATFYGFKAMAEYVQESGKKLSGDLVYTAVVQEEPAEMFGMEYFMDYTMPEHNIKCDLVYVAEPSGGCVVTGQRGKMELVIKTYGKCAHSSAPEEGVNALEHMVPILNNIFKHKGIDLRKDAYGVTPITVTNIIVKPGGTLSCIPDECEIAVDRRYVPGQTDEMILGEFEAMFEELKKEYPDFSATVEPRYFDETSWTGYTHKVRKWHPSWQTPKDSEFIAKTHEALNEMGLPIPPIDYANGGTDGSMTCAIRGIPTIIYCGVEPFTCHQEKEHVSMAGLMASYIGYVSILAKQYGIDVKEFDK